MDTLKHRCVGYAALSNIHHSVEHLDIDGTLTTAHIQQANEPLCVHTCAPAAGRSVPADFQWRAPGWWLAQCVRGACHGGVCAEPGGAATASWQVRPGLRNPFYGLKAVIHGLA